MDHTLEGKSVAILMANGFEELAMADLQKALIAAEATVKIISPESNLVNGWQGKGWGHYFPVDAPIAQTLAADFDCLLVPDGVRSIDKLSGNPHTRRILKGFTDGAKGLALIGQATRLLAVADRARGRAVLATDEYAEPLVEAGATRSTDGPILVDETLLTATPDAPVDDLKARVIALFATAEGPPEAMDDAAQEAEAA